MEAIDLCVAFNGDNTDVFGQLFFGTLLKSCNLENVRIHMINNGRLPEIVYLPYKININEYDLTKQYPVIAHDAHPSYDFCVEAVLRSWEMADWMVNNCGKEKWCIISHFDLAFHADIIRWFRERMSDKVGIIGSHCPIMAVNRVAYSNRRVGFEPGVGCDVGMLLINDLINLGWQYHPFDANTYGESNKFFYHFREGGSYHTQYQYYSMRHRVTTLLAKMGWLQ